MVDEFLQPAEAHLNKTDKKLIQSANVLDESRYIKNPTDEELAEITKAQDTIAHLDNPLGQERSKGIVARLIGRLKGDRPAPQPDAGATYVDKRYNVGLAGSDQPSQAEPIDYSQLPKIDRSINPALNPLLEQYKPADVRVMTNAYFRILEKNGVDNWRNRVEFQSEVGVGQPGLIPADADRVFDFLSQFKENPLNSEKAQRLM